jgi:FlaA1/EpsC-like NDP-sugar epimerase
LLHDIVDGQQTLAHFHEIRPDVIFHAAAHKHVPMMEDHPAAAVDNNLFGTKSVADAAHAVGTGRFVMISTDKAVNPVSIMGATKRLAELYIQHLSARSRTVFSMVRFGNVLGSSGSVLDTWTRQIADGGPITVTDQRMTRYFMSIHEAAALVIQSAALVEPDAPNGEVFLLNMGEPIRIVDLARRFIELHGLSARIANSTNTALGPSLGSIDISLTGIRPGEKLFEELAFDTEAMRPTTHPDINIWMVPPANTQQVDRFLALLDPENVGRFTTIRESSPSELREIILGLVQPVNSRKVFSHKDLHQTAA